MNKIFLLFVPFSLQLFKIGELLDTLLIKLCKKDIAGSKIEKALTCSESQNLKIKNRFESVH